MKEDESLVLRARDYADIAKLAEPTVAEQFLAEPLSVIVEVMTGLIADGPRALAARGGHIVQAVLKGKMLEQWAREIQELRAKGAIADDFESTKYGFQTWAELFSIIDEERPDADRLEALKAMFLAVNKVNATDGERILAYQLWNIAKQLSSGELLLLKAAYENRESEFEPYFANKQMTSESTWARMMASQLGHGVTDLVQLHKKKLLGFGLLAPASETMPDAIPTTNARLSDLGLRFCENIRTFTLLTGPKSM